MPADPEAVIFQRPEVPVVLEPSTLPLVRYSVTWRPWSQAALGDVTLPLNVSPLLLIEMCEAIVTVLDAAAEAHIDTASANALSAISHLGHPAISTPPSKQSAADSSTVSRI